MALIVEDGTGLTNSEVYASLAFVDTYHADRGNTLWASLSTNEKEQAIRRAADYMRAAYRGGWKGYRTKTTQALDWPRYEVFIDDYTIVSSSIVPIEVQQANAALAFNAAQGEMIPDITQGVIREKVDVLEVEYDPNSPRSPRYKAVDLLLGQYLNGSTSGIMAKLVRV
jgi:hypothetical protein